MVETIESNGNKYPILVNTFVLGKVQLETGYGFDIVGELDKKMWLYEPLIWHSLEVGHTIAKIPFDMKREDMVFFLSDDKVYRDFVDLLPKFFTMMNKKDGSDPKKKSI